jgi:MFS transporter, DHA2 family, multidrug resistance protein
MNIRLILGIAAAVLAQSLDAKLLAPVLPLVRGDFGLTADEGSWIQIIYLMTNVAALPLSPWCVERFGGPRVVLASLGGFIACALVCACSPNLPVLLLGRALQGVCGAGLISTCHAAMREAFPESRLAAGQVAFVGAFVGAPLALGPFIGGTLVDAQASWRWIFVLEALVGIAGFVACRAVLREDTLRSAPRPLDIGGACLMALCLAPLQYVFVQGDRFGWFDDTSICAAAALTAAGFTAFAVWEWYADAPLFDLRALARRPRIAIGAALIFPIGVCLVASVAIVTGFVQQLLGFTATMAGELVLIRAASFIPFAFLFGALIDRRRLAPQILVPPGLTMLAVACVMQASVTTTGTDFVAALAALIVGGVAIGPVIIPLLWSVFRAVPRDGNATVRAATVIDLALQLGTVAAGAVVVTILDRRFAFHFEMLRSTVTRARLAIVALPPHANRGGLLGLVTQQAYALAFADAALVIGAIALAAFPLALLLRRRAAA